MQSEAFVEYFINNHIPLLKSLFKNPDVKINKLIEEQNAKEA